MSHNEQQLTCKHIHLVKTTLNHGTFANDIYRCENPACGQLLKGKLSGEIVERLDIPAEGPVDPLGDAAWWRAQYENLLASVNATQKPGVPDEMREGRK